MRENLYELLKKIIQHPEKKEILEELLVKEIKKMIKNLLETLILEERKVFCEEIGDVGNGYFLRSLKTPLGEIRDLRVARTREKNFKTALFEPYSRGFLYLDELIFYMYEGGCSTRDVARTLEKIYGFKYSPASISRITSVVVEKIEEFRKAPITKWYPILYVDGTYLKFRRGGVVEKEVVYVVMGLSEDGYKEILGFWIPGGSGESALNWKEIFKELYERGLKEPLLIVGDDLSGLEEAVKLVYPLAEFQSCVLHKIRNTLNKVRKRDRALVAEDLKRMYETHSEGDWRAHFERFKRNWAKFYPEIIKSWERDFDKLTVYLRYPYPLRSFIYTTNSLERFIKEVKRRAKVIEVFPDKVSVDKIVYLVVDEMNERYERKKLKNFERIIEELRELRRARYGEEKIRIITKEEKIHTQFS
jgi:transposase-like protein